MVANVEHMMSLRKNPWHKIGTVIEEPVGSFEAIHLAGLNWEIGLAPVYYGEDTAIDGCNAVVRSDTGKCIGTVGNNYKTFQNHQLFETIEGIAQGESVTWETAGVLDEGRTVWALARLDDLEIRVGDDVAQPYMLCTTGHVGNQRVVIQPTTVRVVCQNTLAMALSGGLDKGHRIGHNGLMGGRVNEAISFYNKMRNGAASTQEAWQYLADKPLTQNTIDIFLETMFDKAPAKSETERAEAMRIKRIATAKDSVKRILESGTSKVKGTSESLLMLPHAFVEYLDHEAGQDKARTKVANFGDGAIAKSNAWDTVMELAK